MGNESGSEKEENSLPIRSLASVNISDAKHSHTLTQIGMQMLIENRKLSGITSNRLKQNGEKKQGREK